MFRAVNMHQVASLGFILVASSMFRHTRQDGIKETPHLPFATLFVATLLFPGLIYVQTLSGKKLWASRFIPTGGILHMVFWLEMCFYFQGARSL